MSEPFIAEVRIFAGTFAPRGYAFCQGQLLPVSQNAALFALIGNMFGGDGRTTMALPNLEGRTPVHAGHGPGLTPRQVGEVGGSPTATLSEAQLPPHNHEAMGANVVGDTDSPTNAAPAQAPGGGRGGAGMKAYGPAQNLVALSPASITGTGGGQAHDNMQPYLAMNFIIALQGVFPSRN